MTDPRQHLRGQVYGESRNTVEGKSFLTASDEVQEVFRYSFALQCSRKGQVPAALLVDEDGYDCVLTDQTGDRSEFWRQCHADVARRGRKAYGIRREELFWEHGRPAETVYLDAEAAIEGILQVYDAALEHGGLEQLADWPVAILPEHWGKKITVQRPETMTNPTFPEFVTVVPMPPPSLMHLGVDGARELVNDRLVARAAEHVQLPEAEETNSERWRDHVRVHVLLERSSGGAYRCARRRERPKFAGSSDAVEAAEDNYAEFKDEYYSAYSALRKRRRGVVFPAGTVFWRRVANVRVAPVLQRLC